TCTYSDVTNQTFAGTSTAGPINCGTAAGNPAGNTTNSTSSQFVFNLFGLNWHLKDTAPAIDTGNPAPLAAGESTTDLDGNPRVLNGDSVCPAIRDKGAFEHATVGSDCSPPSSSSSPAGSPPQPQATCATTIALPLSAAGHKKHKRHKRTGCGAPKKKKKKR